MTDWAQSRVTSGFIRARPQEATADSPVDSTDRSGGKSCCIQTHDSRQRAVEALTAFV